MHRFVPHLPPLQTKLQHSVGEVHASSAVLQLPMGLTQVLSEGSQFAEQQSAFFAQLVPTSPQLPLPSGLPSAEASDELSVPASVGFFVSPSESLPQAAKASPASPSSPKTKK